MSRAYTKEEMRELFLDHLRAMARYWATTKLRTGDYTPGESETEIRAFGLLHSVLATIDGCSGEMPAFTLIPEAHPDDERYCKENGENWWPANVAINDDVHLHDFLYKRKEKL